MLVIRVRGSFVTGKFIPSSDLIYIEVTHNLGRIPKCAAYYIGSMLDYTDLCRILSGFVIGDSHYSCKTPANRNSFHFNGDTKNGITDVNPTSTPSICYHIVAYAANEKTIKFGNENQTLWHFKAGSYYYYYIIFG